MSCEGQRADQRPEGAQRQHAVRFSVRLGLIALGMFVTATFTIAPRLRGIEYHLTATRYSMTMFKAMTRSLSTPTLSGASGPLQSRLE